MREIISFSMLLQIGYYSLLLQLSYVTSCNLRAFFYDNLVHTFTCIL